LYTKDLASTDLEAASIIALWLLIHGGDPAPKTQEDIATVAGQIIASLSTFAFGSASETSVEAIRKRLASLSVEIKDSQSAGSGRGGSDITPDYLVVGSGRVRYLVWPNPDGPPIIVPIYEETLT